MNKQELQALRDELQGRLLTMLDGKGPARQTIEALLEDLLGRLERVEKAVHKLALLGVVIGGRSDCASAGYSEIAGEFASNESGAEPEPAATESVDEPVCPACGNAMSSGMIRAGGGSRRGVRRGVDV